MITMTDRVQVAYTSENSRGKGEKIEENRIVFMEKCIQLKLYFMRGKIFYLF